MKVYLETLGCQMNRLDSELIVGSLRQAGYDVVPERLDADVVLYNTCSVRDRAEHKVHSRVGADCRRKAEGSPRLIVGVLGCMAQRLGADLLRRHAGVDIVCSPGQLHRLGEMIRQAAGGHKAIAVDPGRRPSESTAASAEAARGLHEDPADQGDMDRLDQSRRADEADSQHQAYVRVMHGCNNFCSYCIVPYTRGAERSRRPGEIVDECRRLVDAGRSEIVLLGQAVNKYRCVDAGESVHFADLLGRVAGIEGLRRLRFVTNYPSELTDEVFHAMRQLPNVCEYLHAPAQSGSDRMLRRMNRRYTRAQYDEMLARARQLVPGVVFAGDFIVGFPGETQEDHDASAELVRTAGYKNVFVFKYSPRPGTTAAQDFADDVPEAVKKERNNELLAIQAEVGLEHHRGYVGQRMEILVEGPSVRVDKQHTPATAEKMQLTGRSRGEHIIVFDGHPRLAGRYVQVEITDATNLTLFGRLAQD